MLLKLNSLYLKIIIQYYIIIKKNFFLVKFQITTTNYLY
jgi:hypothetical protein